MTRAEKLYQEREMRIGTSVSLRVPDQVPMLLFLNHYPARYSGFAHLFCYRHLQCFNSPS